MLLVCLLVGTISAFFALDVPSHLTLAALRDSRAAIGRLCDAHTWLAPLSYAAFYMAAAALTLPINVPLSLGAGALFGVAEGILVVSFASAAGATLSMLSSRFLLRDLVRARLGGRLAQVEAGMARDGVFYLFALRLAPVAPYTVVNLLFGLTEIAAWKFYAITQIGALPTLAVFVNAGMRLDRLSSVGDILSPGMIAALLLLAALPLTARYMRRSSVPR